jgi:hypothetical protein
LIVYLFRKSCIGIFCFVLPSDWSMQRKNISSTDSCVVTCRHPRRSEYLLNGQVYILAAAISAPETEAMAAARAVAAATMVAAANRWAVPEVWVLRASTECKGCGAQRELHQVNAPCLVPLPGTFSGQASPAVDTNGCGRLEGRLEEYQEGRMGSTNHTTTSLSAMEMAAAPEKK